MFLKFKDLEKYFYKTEENDKFIDFFSSSFEVKEENKDKKLNNKKKTEDNFVPLIGEPIIDENQKIKINVNRSGDVIESIDIECECGNKTKILIEYGE